MQQAGSRISMLMAAIAGLPNVGNILAQGGAAKKSRRYPSMVTSSPEEIAAWNKAVAERKAAQRKARPFMSERRERSFNKHLRKLALRQQGQFPKFPKERAHKPHPGVLRDEHGAYTLVGSVYEVEGMSPSDTEHVIAGGKDHGQPFYTARRKWLAGVSAMRGY